MSRGAWERFHKRWLYRLAGIIGRYLIDILGMTCRYRVKGMEAYKQASSEQKCILMFWHGQLVMITQILKRYTPSTRYAVLISDSRDGEIIATVVNSYRLGRSIRIPHHSRQETLEKMIKQIRYFKDVFIVTPDGPRGPRCQVKPGIVLAAQESGARVVPLTWKATRYWKLSSWDEMVIPKPFSTIEVNVGEPFEIAKNISTEEGIKRCEASMREID